jgi:superfamily II DNA or RNA helicase
MKTKNEVQKEIIATIINNNFRGIVLSSVRSGKTRILLSAIKKHCLKEDGGNKHMSILVLYPNIDIKKSWMDECDKMDYHPNITYSTFASIDKFKDRIYDYIIVDEAHLLGEENQLPAVALIAKNNKHLILASGTFSEDTMAAIRSETFLKKIVHYSTEDAIKDGIVSDFKIIIHQYSLNSVIPVSYGKVKKWKNTELAECLRLSKAVTKAYGQHKMFAALNRMRFINSTNSLVHHVNNWIKNNPDERFILFTGDEKIGLKYNLPMYNSKSETDAVLLDFLKGDINQLCLIKKGSAGVTYPNLKTILITAINSNGENLEQMLGRSLLTDTEDADIHIFVSDQDFQLNWLKQALYGINKDKISYLYKE